MNNVALALVLCLATTSAFAFSSQQCDPAVQCKAAFDACSKDSDCAKFWQATQNQKQCKHAPVSTNAQWGQQCFEHAVGHSGQDNVAFQKIKTCVSDTETIPSACFRVWNNAVTGIYGAHHTSNADKLGWPCKIYTQEHHQDHHFGGKHSGRHGGAKHFGIKHHKIGTKMVGQDATSGKTTSQGVEPRVPKNLLADAPVRASKKKGFNCMTKELWSDDKKAWCCAHKDIGCDGSAPATDQQLHLFCAPELNPKAPGAFDVALELDGVTLVTPDKHTGVITESGDIKWDNDFTSTPANDCAVEFRCWSEFEACTADQDCQTFLDRAWQGQCAEASKHAQSNAEWGQQCFQGPASNTAFAALKQCASSDSKVAPACFRVWQGGASGVFNSFETKTGDEVGACDLTAVSEGAVYYHCDHANMGWAGRLGTQFQIIKAPEITGQLKQDGSIVWSHGFTSRPLLGSNQINPYTVLQNTGDKDTSSWAWRDAAAKCEAIGLKHAEIYSISDIKLAADAMGQAHVRQAWMALRKKSIDSKHFYWSSGKSTLGFGIDTSGGMFPWSGPTEPNNWEGHEACVEMFRSPEWYPAGWGWNDRNCNTQLPVLCMKPADPALADPVNQGADQCGPEVLCEDEYKQCMGDKQCRAFYERASSGECHDLRADSNAAWGNTCAESDEVVNQAFKGLRSCVADSSRVNEACFRTWDFDIQGDYRTTFSSTGESTSTLCKVRRVSKEDSETTFTYECRHAKKPHKGGRHLLGEHHQDHHHFDGKHSGQHGGAKHFGKHHKMGKRFRRHHRHHGKGKMIHGQAHGQYGVGKLTLDGTVLTTQGKSSIYGVVQPSGEIVWSHGYTSKPVKRSANVKLAMSVAGFDSLTDEQQEQAGQAVAKAIPGAKFVKWSHDDEQNDDDDDGKTVQSDKSHRSAESSHKSHGSDGTSHKSHHSRESQPSHKSRKSDQSSHKSHHSRESEPSHKSGHSSHKSHHSQGRKLLVEAQPDEMACELFFEADSDAQVLRADLISDRTAVEKRIQTSVEAQTQVQVTLSNDPLVSYQSKENDDEFDQEFDTVGDDDGHDDHHGDGSRRKRLGLVIGVGAVIVVGTIIALLVRRRSKRRRARLANGTLLQVGTGAEMANPSDWQSVPQVYVPFHTPTNAPPKAIDHARETIA